MSGSEKWFAVPGDKNPQAPEKWTEIIINQAEYDKRRLSQWNDLQRTSEESAKAAAKREAEEKHVAKEAATLAAGAALCGKAGLDELCYISLAPSDFFKNFGGSFTQKDKAAFYNAWRLGTERQKQEIARQKEADEIQRESQKELKDKDDAAEAARERTPVYQPMQVIYPDNSQQQMTNFLLLNQQIQHAFQPIYQPPIRNTNCYTAGAFTNCTGY